MAQHQIEPKVDLNEYFYGLSRQAMDFHQALAELVDNGLSARTAHAIGGGAQDTNPAYIEVCLEETDSGSVKVTVADAGVGMTIPDLRKHVFGLGQKGSTSTSEGTLNEHGFGLKNALSVLTGGNSTKFAIVTRSDSDGLADDQFVRVQGPFSSTMAADDSARRDTDWAPGLFVLQTQKTGTRVDIEADGRFFRTLWKRRGAPSQFEAYVTRLAEHLGVIYRYFIEAGDRLYLSWKPKGGQWSNPVKVMAIKPPYGKKESELIRLKAAGKTLEVTYNWGENDYTLREEGPEPERAILGNGDPAYPYPLKIYYQGSSARSGADIVVRKRLIQTEVWKDIWSDLPHTVEYNRWLAEIILDENFRTTNNKTGMDPNGTAWQSLLDEISPVDSPYSPTKKSPEQTEKSLEEALSENLRIMFPPKDRIGNQVTTWSGGVTADVVVFSPDKKSIDQIYEVKAGRATVDDVYQLVAQWDGFVKDQLTPKEGIVYCAKWDHKAQAAIDSLNKRKDGRGRLYKLRLEAHAGSGFTYKAPPRKLKKASTKKRATKRPSKAPAKKAAGSRKAVRPTG